MPATFQIGDHVTVNSISWVKASDGTNIMVQPGATGKIRKTLHRADDTWHLVKFDSHVTGTNENGNQKQATKNYYRESDLTHVSDPADPVALNNGDPVNIGGAGRRRRSSRRAHRARRASRRRHRTCRS